VAAKNSLSQSMDNAVKHYASLFRLPSQAKVILYQVLLCVGGGVLSVVFLFPNGEGLVNGLLLGLSLFGLTLALDYATSKLILRHDPIYDTRRTGVVSLTCWAIWLFFIIVGDAVSLCTADLAWWVRLCLLGLSASLILRLIVFNASSAMAFARIQVASLIQPLLSGIPFLLLWLRLGYPVTFQMLLFFVLSPAISFASVYGFLHLIDNVGKRSLGIPSLAFFKAFMLTWIANWNDPFEELLENLGEERDVELFLVKFDSFKTKATIVVPSVHPGPFKNIGSSILPALLKNALEKEFECVASTPHGLFGHELDLASQLQNQRIIRHVIEGMTLVASESKASPFVTVSKDSATACCQIFGDFAFLSVTLAPKTTEDFPPELGMFVREEARKHKLACCAVVNAHNSIDGMEEMFGYMDSLKNVAAACLEKTAALKREPFEVGAATVLPKEYDVGDGMGDGGITVTVVKVGKQKSAYVVIDGNNMMCGVREEILSALFSFGIDAGEVYTTDTHSVNAVILGRRGYHPVGEAIDHEKLIGYIKEATLSALSNLERVKAGCRSITVPKAKVIGTEKLEMLSILTDKGLQRAKRSTAPVFALAGLLLMLFLLFV